MTMYERITVTELDEDDIVLTLFDGPQTLFSRIYLPIYRLFRWHLNPMILVRKIKWFIQRGRRGYADCDVWRLSDYLCVVMRDSIRQLVEQAHGWPVNEVLFATFEDWQKTLERVADGLDHCTLALNGEETCNCCGKYCKEMECPIVAEAFEELLAIWPGLWD